MLSRIRHLLRRLVGQEPIIVPAPISRELTAKERLAIRDWLNLDTTQFVLGLLEARHPGTQTSRISVTPRDANDAYGAVFVLHRIRGWESYRNSLLTLHQPPRTAGALVETYPTE